jgi:integrase
MTVYWDEKRQKYRAVVFFGGKAVASRRFAKEKPAKIWHDTELARYRHLDPSISDVKWTYEQLIARYVNDHLAKKSPGTRARYTTEIEKRITPFFQFVHLAKIDANMLDAFKEKLEKECAPKEANYCLELTRAILNRAVKFRMLRVSPYCLERVEMPRRSASGYDWWDDKEFIRRFLEVARERTKFYPAYLLGLETGMREGEVAGLWKGDVDLEAGRIHVQRKWDWTDGDYGPPKHGIRRWIDFDPKSRLAHELRRQMALHPTSELVFPSSSGRPLSRSSYAEKTFKSVQEQAQVPKLNLHSLRHTFASWYMIERDDLWTLKGILGHADIRTTQRYAHHSAKLRKTPLDLSSVVTPKSLPFNPA